MNLDALIALKTKLMNDDVNGTTLHPRLMDWILDLKQKHKADREREALKRS
jgi:hypothetical protein